MNKIMGVQGTIVDFPFRDLQETIYDQDGMTIEVKEDVLYVSVDDIAKITEAKDLARLYLLQWSRRQGIKLSIEFNSEWSVDSEGKKHYYLELKDSVKTIDRIITTEQHISGKSRIVTVEMHDSASFSNDDSIIRKAQKYPVLKSVLVYYGEEVIEDERPLYGIYKALEAITSHLNSKDKNGRMKLALLVNQPLSYVGDVMQTSQVERHHETNGTRKISDEECRNRAKLLIDAFANSLA